jgi:subtilisin family serine protease
MFVEWKDFNYMNGGKPGYLVFKKTSNKANFDIRDLPEDIRNLDLSFADLSRMYKGFIQWRFNEKTIFPTDKNKMPDLANYQPKAVLEAGKNPGLGVRSIHEQGITGKGVNVAILDMSMLTGHPEYKDKIVEYTDMVNIITSFHGPMVTSLLAGETIGTAPGVKVYFYVPGIIVTDDDKYDAVPWANVLDMIVEKNKILPDGVKIKIISISAATTPLGSGYDDSSLNPSRKPWANGEIYLESYKRATESGILILDASVENGIIGGCKYDFEKPEDITLCEVVDYGWGKKEILAPMHYRTVAESTTEGEYLYMYGTGGLSCAIPYAAGVLAMGWEVKPELTADEIVKILLDTAYVGKDGNKFIYPTAFIEYLRNN